MASCPGCGAEYPSRMGILDLLGTPEPPVAEELRGLANENGIDVDRDGWEAIKLLRVPQIATPPELMDQSRNQGVQYYQLSYAAYLEGLARSQIDSSMKVLEIGAGHSLWYLRILEALCTEAYALNICFQVPEGSESMSFPQRIIGDMNNLPFMDGYLDLVICSATLHHSYDLAGSLKEIARVLRLGGRAVVVNEPVAGRLKGLGGGTPVDRDPAINEGSISLSGWSKAIRASGLRSHHFVPAHFSIQLSSRHPLPAGTRFRGLAHLIRPFASNRALNERMLSMLRVPGQTLLGLPLNTVLWKSCGNPVRERASL